MTTIADDLAADLGSDFQVTTTPQGWTEVRVRPERAIGDKIDFVRIVTDDSTYRLIHLTHNAVCKGVATFSGSMIGLLPAVVREFCEVEF
ncbi:Uncharacterised protein [Mycobacteroides abscessus subsp. bolletii]|uniref:hypothetical protein n=1 Tax=Mycobacteroides abscessus TaxID=36809 RepID=UPI0009A64714|nr:hypothetical protein [Mycobacteroides abscessus]SLE16140.1 Uncharacterised protein [Mycobacteroides abscessus subsp. bolletii]